MTTPLYGPDLAAIQHTGFSGFSRGASKGLLKILADAGLKPSASRPLRVVDLGCGDGTWLKALTNAGYEAVGMDASPSLVKIAKHIAPKAKIQRATLADFAIPSCDAVTALGEVLAYLAPGAARARLLGHLFRRIARKLPPGGLLIFDLIMAGKAMNYRSSHKGPGWRIDVQLSENLRTRILTRHVAIQRKTKTGTVRKTTEVHRQRIFGRAEVITALRAAGFTVKTAQAYGTQPMLPRRLAFIARKRAE